MKDTTIPVTRICLFALLFVAIGVFSNCKKESAAPKPEPVPIHEAVADVSGTYYGSVQSWTYESPSDTAWTYLKDTFQLNVVKVDTTYWMQVSWGTPSNIRYHLPIFINTDPLEFRYPFRVDPVYGFHDRNFGLLKVRRLQKTASGYQYFVMDTNRALGTVFSGQKIE